MKKLLNYFINSVNQIIKKNKKYVYIQSSGFLIHIVMFLKSKNYVLGYKIYKYRILIYFNLKKIKKIKKNINFKSINIGIGYKNIRIFANKELVISTTKGILTDREAKKIMIGGICLFYIYYV